jgi:hypothetical protein
VLNITFIGVKKCGIWRFLTVTRMILPKKGGCADFGVTQSLPNGEIGVAARFFEKSQKMLTRMMYIDICIKISLFVFLAVPLLRST